jgi:hypothetical protein
MKGGGAPKSCRNILHLRLDQSRYDSLPHLPGRLLIDTKGQIR